VLISTQHEAGAQGGKTSGSSGGDNYKPSENDGLTKDGSVDGRTKEGGNTAFAHGKVDPVEAGKKVHYNATYTLISS
jgi:hypothetical protein